jgi:hypothetical protein
VKTPRRPFSIFWGGALLALAGCGHVPANTPLSVSAAHPADRVRPSSSRVPDADDPGDEDEDQVIAPEEDDGDEPDTARLPSSSAANASVPAAKSRSALEPH